MDSLFTIGATVSTFTQVRALHISIHFHTPNVCILMVIIIITTIMLGNIWGITGSLWTQINWIGNYHIIYISVLTQEDDYYYIVYFLILYM